MSLTGGLGLDIPYSQSATVNSNSDDHQRVQQQHAQTNPFGFAAYTMSCIVLGWSGTELLSQSHWSILTTADIIPPMQTIPSIPLIFLCFPLPWLAGYFADGDSCSALKVQHQHSLVSVPAHYLPYDISLNTKDFVEFSCEFWCELHVPHPWLSLMAVQSKYMLHIKVLSYLHWSLLSMGWLLTFLCSCDQWL